MATGRSRRRSRCSRHWKGWTSPTPAFAPYVLPAAVVILIALFAIQPQGTARIGRAFGPIMALWFVTIAVLGLWGIARHPAVLAAIDPRYGIDLSPLRRSRRFSRARRGVPVRHRRRGAVRRYGAFRRRADPAGLVGGRVPEPRPQLCRPGGAGPRRRAGIADNIFYRLCPSFLLVPLIVLATVATIIASQSIITGAFSMTRQAIQLGWLPPAPDHADIRRRLWPDLCRHGQLAADAGDARAHGRFRQVRQSRGRLRHRRVGDHADDLGAACSSRCARSGDGALLRPARSPASSSSVDAQLLHRQPREDRGGRIRAARPGGARLRRDADLASRSRCGRQRGCRSRWCPSRTSWRRSPTDRSRACPAPRFS